MILLTLRTVLIKSWDGARWKFYLQACNFVMLLINNCQLIMRIYFKKYLKVTLVIIRIQHSSFLGAPYFCIT